MLNAMIINFMLGTHVVGIVAGSIENADIYSDQGDYDEFLLDINLNWNRVDVSCYCSD